MSALRIAVTGAGGYIGRRLVQALKDQGHRVLAMGRKPVPEADAFVPFALGGQNDYAPLAGLDWLIHAAYDFTCIGEAAIRRVNCRGSAELFTQAKAHGVKRLLYISSLSAFEGAVSDYGRLKFETETEAQKVRALIVRPGLVFSRDAGGIVGALDRLVQKLPAVPMVGNGRQIFYPCHNDDLCRLLLHMLSQNVQQTRPVTAACEHFITFRQILTTLAQSHHRSVLTVPVPYALVFAGLKAAELLRLNTGLRSDSLKYMKHINPNVDFGFLREAGIAFRPFTAETVAV